jgi:hypothetical protein
MPGIVLAALNTVLMRNILEHYAITSNSSVVKHMAPLLRGLGSRPLRFFYYIMPHKPTEKTI